jgi:hypothetical protein
MPYIDASKRPALDAALGPLIAQLRDNPEMRDGALNYCITRLLQELYPRNYASFNAALGVLEAAKLEFYRRVLAPYEDEKIARNGDVLYYGAREARERMKRETTP